jgi:hypothetical protein
MGASNGSSTSGGKSFYALKEKKAGDAANTGNIRFYKSIKVGDKWTLGEGFTQMSGILRSIDVKEFQYQGKPKHSLIFTIDDDKTDEVMEVTTSFPTTVSKNILNALSNVEKYGVISLEVGNPQEYQGKMYPSIFIKNDGETCKFAFTNAKGNAAPKVETIRDEEGNEIKKGVVAERTFWIDQINKINLKLRDQVRAVTAKPATYVAPVNPKSSDAPAAGSFEEESDLPF